MPQHFVRRAQYVDCLPVPGPLFPISVYLKDIDDTKGFVVDFPPSSSFASRFLSQFSVTGLF